MLKTPKFWQSKGLISTLLLPASKLYEWVSHQDLASKAKKAQRLPKPTIVIGNINVGGTGKTPATITLTKELQKRGLKVGILSRGFGRKHSELHIANDHSTAEIMGDEPFLIYQKTTAPMAIDASRYTAGMALLEQYPDLDCFICDDALQHQQLSRDIEIIVVGKQGFGNERIFPAGPLREPTSRLNSADFILSNNADTSELKAKTSTPIIELHSELLSPINLHTQVSNPFTDFQNQPLTAIAGIAHPENFYTMLQAKGLTFQTRSFPDHFQFTDKDLQDITTPILMTEKDASKCRHLKRQDLWAVPLENKICSRFIDTLTSKIHDLNHNDLARKTDEISV
ncbi:tetraacyldisaccharide 4'-kinase [Ignatzschineria sp. LJL83]